MLTTDGARSVRGDTIAASSGRDGRRGTCPVRGDTIAASPGRINRREARAPGCEMPYS